MKLCLRTCFLVLLLHLLFSFFDRALNARGLISRMPDGFRLSLLLLFLLLLLSHAAPLHFFILEAKGNREKKTEWGERQRK
jgi:hypothetical protein